MNKKKILIALLAISLLFTLPADAIFATENPENSETQDTEETESEENETEEDGHSYLVTYEWAEDYATCNAILTCQTCQMDPISVECQVTADVTKEATSEEDGEVVYTAYFIAPDLTEETDTKSLEIRAYNPELTLSKTTYTYTGKECKPTVTAKDADGNVISSENYALAYTNDISAGTAKVTLDFAGKYSGSLSKTYTINKAANPFAVTSTKRVTYNYTVVKKAAKTFAIKTSGAKGKVTYKSSSKYVTVSSKGKVTVKKGAPKATYTITLKAAGNSCYKEKTATVKVVVRNIDWVTSLKAAKSTKQIIIVSYTGGSSATVSMHTKDSYGYWNQNFSVSGRVGKNGIGKTREGDCKTPTGKYKFVKAFGVASNPGCSLTYTKVDSSYYWVDDSKSSHYNQFVSTKTVKKDWKSAEHIIDCMPYYKYVLALNYNTAKRTPGKGSGIFLHCGTIGTHGCIAIPEKYMRTVMQKVQPGCVIIIDYSGKIKNY